MKSHWELAAAELLELAGWCIRHVPGVSAERILLLLVGPCAAMSSRRQLLERAREAAKPVDSVVAERCRRLLTMPEQELAGVCATTLSLLRGSYAQAA